MSDSSPELAGDISAEEITSQRAKHKDGFCVRYRAVNPRSRGGDFPG